MAENNLEYTVNIDGQSLGAGYYFGEDCVVTFPDEQKEKKVKSLYKVFVVNLEREEVKFDIVTVARDKQQAKMLAVQYGYQKNLFPDDADLDNYGFVVQLIGEIPERE